MKGADVDSLIKQFRLLADAAADQDPALRAKLRDHLDRYLRSKGSAGGTFAEAADWVFADQTLWPEDPGRLVGLLSELYDPFRLPPLQAPGQLAWLGYKLGYERKTIDAAVAREFPDLPGSTGR